MRLFRDIAATVTAARPQTGIGAPVMALGIFGVAALQRLPGGAVVVAPLTALLVAIWAIAAALLLASIRRRGLAEHTRPVIESFAIGTWIAGTAVVARMTMIAAPGLSWAAASLFALGLVLWLWFLPLALKNLLRLARAPWERPSGVILLVTVATQAIALIGLRLFPGAPEFRHIAAALAGLAAVCYVVGVVLVITRLWTARGWGIERDWDNANCIIHGALSITGLTVIVGDFVPAEIVLYFWVWVVAVFASVELIELARLTTRIQNLGLRRAVLVYDPSQWTRNFTFGMFYAFTLTFAERFAIDDRHPVLDALRAIIVETGQYLVLVLLLVEVGLLLRSRAISGV